LGLRGTKLSGDATGLPSLLRVIKLSSCLEHLRHGGE